MPAPAPASAAPPNHRLILGCAALLGLAALAAYANTFTVPFLFDDTPSILDNPSIRHLWPLGDVLSPSAGYGITVSGRPVLNLSLALSYALSGTDVWGYHALNLVIHLFAGLTLFGVARRTMARAGGAEPTLAAFAVALLWILHPLQTEAVTYIIQRTESLMGLFFLLTFYCFIRAAEETGETIAHSTTMTPRHKDDPDQARASLVSQCLCGSRRPAAFWGALSFLACLAGMGTKEVTAVAPVLVLLYDRTFVAGSFREAWRRRRGLHLALAATWLPLAALVSSTGWNRGGTAGFNVGLAPWAYWFTQFEAVARYLKQAVWPHPLVFEFGTFWMGPADAAPYALVVVPLALATLWALWRRPVAGFLGAWFFAILAPTSVIPGTIQMIVEHRMYLPLAAVVALLVGAAVNRLGRPALVSALALAVGFGGLTVRRNAEYGDDLVLWRETVARSPGSAIAQSNLGIALAARGRRQEAMQHYRISLSLNPNVASVHYNLGLNLAAMGRLPQALEQYQAAFRLNPRFYPAQYQLGLVLLQQGRPAEALPHFEAAVRLMPTLAPGHYAWGVALARLDRPAEAVPHYEEALRLDPGYAEADCDLGVALLRADRAPEAVQRLQQALRISPDFPEAHFNLGLAFAREGRPDEAEAQYAEAVRLNPRHYAAQLNLGIALAQANRVPEALEHLRQAVQLVPGAPEAHCNLGIALAAAGRWSEAVAEYREALRLRPDYAIAYYNLGNAFIALRRGDDARSQFEEALRLDPQNAGAREMLDRLRPAPGGP